MLNFQVEDQSSCGGAKRHSSPFVPIVISVIGALVWLVFILSFALFWSKSYNIFQDFVVFIATLFIAAIVIGLMWLIWGRNQWHWASNW
ncbi:MAG: hypothetical protein ABSG33_12275 [Candidatus Bathyarchaeia archaeon]|jgi:hypothetical protein